VEQDLAVLQFLLQPRVVQQGNDLSFTDWRAVVDDPLEDAGHGTALIPGLDPADDLAVLRRFQIAANDDGRLQRFVMDGVGVALLPAVRSVVHQPYPGSAGKGQQETDQSQWQEQTQAGRGESRPGRHEPYSWR